MTRPSLAFHGFAASRLYHFAAQSCVPWARNPSILRIHRKAASDRAATPGAGTHGGLATGDDDSFPIKPPSRDTKYQDTCPERTWDRKCRELRGK